MKAINELGPGALAFVGDAVYTLLMRESLAGESIPFKELNNAAAKAVSAQEQAAAYSKIEPLLSEDEKQMFLRGRNHHTNNLPKSATVGQYHTATGLECLFGYLYLTGQRERIRELFGEIYKE